MIEVYEHFFIGTQQDCSLERARPADLAVVHACRTCHQRVVGSAAQHAHQDDPEWFVARRGQDCFLNLVDSEYPGLIRKEALIDPALQFIDEMRRQGADVLVHCEQGRSRSPSLLLLYLASRLNALPTASLLAAEAQFTRLYPDYVPGYGIWAHLRHYWEQYCADGRRGL